MIYHERVQTTITAPPLTNIILNIVVWHYGSLDSIVSDRGSVFTPKFWSFLYYFLSIKWRLSTTFYPQTNSQTEWRNNMIKSYLRVFVNYKQGNWLSFLPIDGFAYNNAKYASREYTSFKLNCGYHLYVSYKNDVNPCSKSKTANKLTKKLRNLIARYRENLQYA